MYYADSQLLYLKESAIISRKVKYIYVKFYSSSIVLNCTKTNKLRKITRELKRIYNTRLTVHFRACEYILETIESIFLALKYYLIIKYIVREDVKQKL